MPLLMPARGSAHSMGQLLMLNLYYSASSHGVCRFLLVKFFSVGTFVRVGAETRHEVDQPGMKLGGAKRRGGKRFGNNSPYSPSSLLS